MFWILLKLNLLYHFRGSLWKRIRFKTIANLSHLFVFGAWRWNHVFLFGRSTLRFNRNNFAHVVVQSHRNLSSWLLKPLVPLLWYVVDQVDGGLWRRRIVLLLIAQLLQIGLVKLVGVGDLDLGEFVLATNLEIIHHVSIILLATSIHGETWPLKGILRHIIGRMSIWNAIRIPPDFIPAVSSICAHLSFLIVFGHFDPPNRSRILADLYRRFGCKTETGWSFILHVFVLYISICENHHGWITIVYPWQGNFCISILKIFLGPVQESQTQFVVGAWFMPNIESFEWTFSSHVIPDHTLLLPLQYCLLVLVDGHFEIRSSLVGIIRVFGVLNSRWLLWILTFLLYDALLQILVKLFHYLVQISLTPLNYTLLNLD